jgi:hypothetical protein
MSEVARLRAENARLRAALAQQQEVHRQELAAEKSRRMTRETELLQALREDAQAPVGKRQGSPCQLQY